MAGVFVLTGLSGGLQVSPWSKTGGLGDVVGGLPVELAKRCGMGWDWAPPPRGSTTEVPGAGPPFGRV
jgi:hypothetical protein